MEQTKYLNMLSDELIKKTAKKLFNNTYGFAKPKYIIERNKDNYIVTIEYKAASRITSILMTDYYAILSSGGTKIEFGILNNGLYRKMMTSFFGKDYKKDVEQYEKELYKNLGLHQHNTKVKNEEFLNFFKNFVGDSNIVKNSLKLSRSNDGNKFIVHWKEFDDENKDLKAILEYDFLHYVYNDYLNSILDKLKDTK